MTGGLSYDEEYIPTDYHSTEILIDGTWVLGNKKAGIFTLMNVPTGNFHLIFLFQAQIYQELSVVIQCLNMVTPFF